VEPFIAPLATSWVVVPHQVVCSLQLFALELVVMELIVLELTVFEAKSMISLASFTEFTVEQKPIAGPLDLEHRRSDRTNQLECIETYL